MNRTESSAAFSARLRACCVVFAAAAGYGSGSSLVADAIAEGETRTLTMFHTHTKENATITFRRNGVYDEAGLKQLNWFLRDWRTNEPTRMDPQVFDAVWAVYREVGVDVPIHIISAYRSPETNGKLRSRSRGVAEHSQHMLGKAMDISLPGVDMNRVRAAAMRLQQGGVGFYGASGFVHIDVAGVRAWPRMSRAQLVSLFPDGKTLHLPPDGKPLERYEEAKAELLARKSAGPAVKLANAEEGGSKDRRSFWATLFAPGADQASAASREPSEAQSPPPAANVMAILRALFVPARVSGDASQPRPARVAVSRAKLQHLEESERAVDSGPPLDLRLLSRPGDDPSPSSFTGPAVKPLPILTALAD